jgi:hypothetical protein
MVSIATVAFVRLVLVQNQDPRTAFRRAWLGQVEALRATPVVLIYRDKDGVKSEALTYSTRVDHVWGLAHRCGTKDCWALPGDVKSTVGGHNHEKAKFVCHRCHGQTSWIARPPWLRSFSEHPFFFAHDYPLTEKQDAYVRESRWEGGCAPENPAMQDVVLNFT